LHGQSSFLSFCPHSVESRFRIGGFFNLSHLKPVGNNLGVNIAQRRLRRKSF
jgi:hypothetical protein